LETDCSRFERACWTRTIARVLFCFHHGELFALHGFIKKTQRTPPGELELARKRKAEVENG